MRVFQKVWGQLYNHLSTSPLVSILMQVNKQLLRISPQQQGGRGSSTT